MIHYFTRPLIFDIAKHAWKTKHTETTTSNDHDYDIQNYYNLTDNIIWTKNEHVYTSKSQIDLMTS